jgi:surface antigen
MRLRTQSILMFGALVLAGCTTTQGSAVIPLAVTEPTIGATGGGTATSAFGAALDTTAKNAARDAEFRALEFGKTGTAVSWRSGKVSGEVVPGARYEINNFNCRDLVTSVFFEGAKRTTRSTSCRQPNGNWQPVT